MNLDDAVGVGSLLEGGLSRRPYPCHLLVPVFIINEKKKNPEEFNMPQGLRASIEQTDSANMRQSTSDFDQTIGLAGA